MEPGLRELERRKERFFTRVTRHSEMMGARPPKFGEIFINW